MQPEFPPPQNDASPASYGPIGVLLVDDQLMVGEAIRRMLVPEKDLAFHYCARSEEAIAKAAEIGASVILQDLVMPGIDGMTMVGRYRAESALRDIPVIVLSSKEDPAIKRDAFVCGATDYLVKLPDPIELIARIRAHARSCQAQRQLRAVQARLEEANAELQRLSNLDSLTGIANRRHFDAVIDREWRRCQRSGHCLSLILVDIDAFKQFNDHYGHQGGDECLRAVAQAMQASVLRGGDWVARYGGEEFGIVLPETDLDGGLAVGERLRGSVQSLGLPHAKSPCAPHVTISLGVAACHPSGATRPDDLIAAADQALYEAKRTGRNRVVAAPSR